MVQAPWVAEMPEDEGVPVPRFSCRARRGIAATGLVFVMVAVLFASSRSLVADLNSAVEPLEPATSLGSLLALLALILVTFFSILTLLASLRSHRPLERVMSPLRRIGEGVVVLFGLLVLVALIPYLVIAPTQVPPWAKALAELWVIFLAPFVVGLFSVRKLVSVRYGLVCAVLSMDLISVVYQSLVYAASPPLVIPRVWVEIYPGLSGPGAGWVSEVMLACLLFGLVLGYGGQALVGSRLSSMALRKRLLFLLMGFVILFAGVGAALFAREGVEQEIPLSRIPPYNGSRGIPESWVEPEDWVFGENLTIFLKAEEVPTDLSLKFSFVTRQSKQEIMGAGGHWEEINGNLFSRTVEFTPDVGLQGVPVSPDAYHPTFLCYLVTENMTSGAQLSNLWTMILPKGSEDPEKLIQPCLYKSRLAFTIDDSFRADKVRLLYFDTAGGSGTRGLFKVSVLDRIYTFSGLGVLPGSKAPPKELSVWDSENESISTQASERRAIFMVIAFEGQSVAVSDVFVS